MINVLAEVNHHLKLIEHNLAGVSDDDSYWVGRIRQNIRLDFPSFRAPEPDRLDDGEAYPPGYPSGRGPNIAFEREQVCLNALTSKRSELSEIANVIDTETDVGILAGTADYLKLFETVHGETNQLAVWSELNKSNYFPRGKAPLKMYRYIDLRSFLSYTLLPAINEKQNAWSQTKRKIFLNSLIKERNAPGDAWRELGKIWKNALRDIRLGKLDPKLTTRDGFPATIFIVGSSTPIHDSIDSGKNSKERVHNIVKRLALPGWEKPVDREWRLGLVCVELELERYDLYKPTTIDNLGRMGYFFLPGRPEENHGRTWILDESLSKNSQSELDGEMEWLLYLEDGVFCCDAKPKAQTDPLSDPDEIIEPKFSLVGLEFGDNHESYLLQE